MEWASEIETTQLLVVNPGSLFISDFFWIWTMLFPMWILRFLYSIKHTGLELNLVFHTTQIGENKNQIYL